MDVITILAAEVGERTLWYPTLQGILVTICAILLFCGSAYLLLATNLGARLGFLVAFTGLMGFMVVLTILWMTTVSPLNTLRGSIPSWKMIGVVETLDQPDVPDEARNIEEEGREADEVQAADVKQAVDANLVTQTEDEGEEVPEGANEFAIYDEVDQYQVTNTWQIGGSDPDPLKLEFRHQPLFAVAQFCSNLPVETPAGLPPPEPQCDPNAESGFVVLERDLGSLRLPPVIAFLASVVLFGLGLLNLHWYELDRRAVAEERTPVPAQA